MQSSSPSQTSLSTADDLLLLPIRGNDIAVAGLIWQPLTALKAPMAEAKQLVKKEQCEHFVLHHQKNKAQCGMTANLPSDKKRYYSAALMLIDKLGSDWLAIFALEQGRYLLLGIEGGQVVPGCDALFSSEAAVLEHFNNYKGLFNWQTIYAPSALELSGEPLDLNQLLKGITPKSAYKINYTRELNKQSQQIGLRVVALAVVISIIFSIWRAYQKDQEKKRLAKLRALELQLQKKKTVVQEVWRQQPPAAELMHDCVQAITHYPITIGGWQAMAVLCDGHSAKALYQRQQRSTVKMFLAALPEQYRQEYKFTQNGETVQLTQAVRMDGNREQERLQPLKQLAADFLAKLQMGAAQGKIDNVLTTAKKSANFELLSQTSPLILFQDINLDGVVFNTISATLTVEGAITWKMSGVIYGE